MGIKERGLSGEGIHVQKMPLLKANRRSGKLVATNNAAMNSDRHTYWGRGDANAWLFISGSVSVWNLNLRALG
jgi:hypothetical protein